jgi:hypothetical protein
MIEIFYLLQTIETYYKSVLAIGGMLLICLASTSCACGGGGCSVGGTETHQALNQRLKTANVEVATWKK